MRKKQDVITFKVDESLRELIQGIPNRSDFIRTALLAALESRCPFCKGSGVLTPKKREHWETFARKHRLKACDDCHELTIVCR